MGYLMKEALKALCGVNQWSYAIFWKFGCQNPKLLIWEECYYEAYPSPNSATRNTVENQGITLQMLEGYQNGTQLENRVHFLVDKMMVSNQVNMVGEGLVGRAAFTGNHQWIVSGNYNDFSYPPEVLHEVNLQFSAGIKTIAVIPVASHGVVQFGSQLTISENVGFVHDVRSLITQLGCVPSAFTPDNYITKDEYMPGFPAFADTANPFVAGSLNLPRNSSSTLSNQSSNSLLTQFRDNLQVSGSSFMMNNLTQDSFTFPGDNYASDTNACAPPGISRIPGGALTPLKSDSAMNHLTNDPGPQISCPESSATYSRSGHLANSIRSLNNDRDANIYCPQSQSFQTSAQANKIFHDTGLSIKNLVASSKTVEQASNSSLLTSLPCYGNYDTDSMHTSKCIPNEPQGIDMQDVLKSQGHLTSNSYPSDDFQDGSQVLTSNNFMSDDSFFQSVAGDDLFDVLGMDLKSKLLNHNDRKLLSEFGGSSDSPTKGMPNSMNLQNFGSGIYRDYEGVSESGVFSSGSDHLLDAVISGVSPDDSMSSRTTASRITTSSVASTPHSNPQHPSPSVGLFTMGDSLKQQLFGLSKSVGEPFGRSIGSVFSKSDGGIHSTTSSAYGSKINSWSEHGPATSVSTANSKKTDEGGKANRKRLKPGESPRPRPKDRQMIQDRVKELREIVPNGAKCSIDSLLERTIKHMLFLQSVSTHADKLKLTESKVDRKEAGMLMKDNFEGGATWAFELGSQTMVCPIVVEDLNPPRQLLVEMLCEERGFFLEIADIIRGLGLTILKGVMEARNDKIWGRFAVEADRDVTRMEVFIALVHLLEQTLNNNTAPIAGASDIPAKQQSVAPIVCGAPPTM